MPLALLANTLKVINDFSFDALNDIFMDAFIIIHQEDQKCICVALLLLQIIRSSILLNEFFEYLVLLNAS